MSHRTLEDSPPSSPGSTHHRMQPLTPQTSGTGPSPLVKVKDRSGYYQELYARPYWDPYAEPFTPNEYGDAIPLVGLSQQDRPYEQLQHTHVVAESTHRRWSHQFEPVPLFPLLLHSILCFAAFPTVYFVARAASGLSLFWTRLIVGGLCGLVGLTLDVSLIDLSRRSIMAALWAVIIHESLRGEVHESLDYHTANPLSPWAAILLLHKQILGKVSSDSKKAVRKAKNDRTPWWLCIVLFLITATVAGCLVFALGRVVDIRTAQQMQTSEYYETTVVGDVTEAEIERAQSQRARFSEIMYTWTITPLSSSAHIPADRSFLLNRTSTVNGTVTSAIDSIHFAETFYSQLAPSDRSPSGFGTFSNQSDTQGVASPGRKPAGIYGTGPTTRADGRVVRWPRWGSRVKCQLIEDLGRYLTTRSTVNSMTYLYVPWTAVRSVFDSMGLPTPNASVFPPVNFAAFMEPGDTPNVTVTERDIAILSKWWNNNVSLSFNSFPVNQGEDGSGWLTVELSLIRVNQAYAPNGSFSVWGEPMADGNRVGFDAAICVEEVKGYVLDAYNNTAGSPVSLHLQYTGAQLNDSAPLLTEDPAKPSKRNRKGEPAPDHIQRGISSAGKWPVYYAAHYSARNLLIKDNGRDAPYDLNPTVVEFGDGLVPHQYNKLNPNNVARIISSIDSQHLLPYLVGTQPVVAYVFPDKTVAYTYVYTTWLAVILAVVFVNGIVVSLFVPRLPLGVSRRDIGVTSWLVAIEDDPCAKEHISPIAGERFERLRRRETRRETN